MELAVTCESLQYVVVINYMSLRTSRAPGVAMLTAHQKVKILEILWGFKVVHLKTSLGIPEHKQSNSVSRMLDVVTPNDTLLDMLVGGLLTIDAERRPPDVDREALAQIFKETDAYNSVVQLAAFAGRGTGNGGGAANGKDAETTAGRKEEGEESDGFIERHIIGLPAGALRSHAERAFPRILGISRLEDATEIVSRCSFLYRLGALPDEDVPAGNSDICDLKYRTAEPTYVIRRVPGVFHYDPRNPRRMVYEENYIERLAGWPALTEDSSTYKARAYVYAQERFLTVFSRDEDANYKSAPSLMQLNWHRFELNSNRRKAKDADLISGILACGSDLPEAEPAPTAYRTIVRLLPPTATWDVVKRLSQTVRIDECEMGDSGKTLLFKGVDHLGCEDDDPASLKRPWSFYFEKLNVIRNPIDLLMCQAARYTPAAAPNGKASAIHPA